TELIPPRSNWACVKSCPSPSRISGTSTPQAHLRGNSHLRVGRDCPRQRVFPRNLLNRTHRQRESEHPPSEDRLGTGFQGPSPLTRQEQDPDNRSVQQGRTVH